MNRQFSVDGPHRLRVSDIGEHRTAPGKMYVAVVLDARSRRVIGLSALERVAVTGVGSAF